MLAVLLFPFLLVVAAAIAAVVVVLRSSLLITSAGVEVHNFPQPPRVFPLAQVGHFEPAPRVGNFSGIRPATAVLVLTDGTRVPVRKISASDAGRGVDALNQRLESLRTGN
ncbi:MAG: hypothetical protein QOF59_679 [Actinomycetota bacterium]|nr:hypothetical protein [Actinomycetota bacterium]MDQ1478551.1 hypothetical protein [Actinomycetota bacterium]